MRTFKNSISIKISKEWTSSTLMENIKLFDDFYDKLLIWCNKNCYYDFSFCPGPAVNEILCLFEDKIDAIYFRLTFGGEIYNDKIYNTLIILN